MIKYLFRRLRKNEKGASIVEFALVLPILLALVMGIIEFGWLFNGHIMITGAAREGARQAIVGKSVEEVIAAVHNHADPVRFQGLTANVVYGEPGEETTVTVSGALPLLIGFGGDTSVIPFTILANPFPLEAEATMRQEIKP